jgi:hypothetical protein
MAALYPGSLFNASAGGLRDGTLTQAEFLSVIDEVEAIEAALGASLEQVNHLLFASTTLRTVASTTAETDLETYSMPANTLNANLKGIRVRGGGSTGPTANNKTIKLLFGAAAISSGAIAINAIDWFADVTILRSAANAQKLGGIITAIAAGYALGKVASGTETDTGAITVRFRAQPATSSANDSITQTWMTVERL